MRIASLAVILSLASPLAQSQGGEPYIADSAPRDKVVSFKQVADLDKDLKPTLEQARSTYPDARRRYLAGLPARYSFFVTVDLMDDEGHAERVFVAVDRIREGRIYGRIWNDITLVKGYSFKQPVVVSEEAILDWLIAHSDGTEEGNFIGKYLEAKQEAQPK